ncbi:MAG: (2Fe-2S)-binding protein [Burkholderiaceae bacterium]|nr:(2Fe-2S)-binding protein [Rhodoferax sp.]MCP5284113.1 (2Fe-2S)-binding protein [Burkholderiaceae bacterium]
MSPPAHFTLDGAAVPFEPGDTVIAAATRAGRTIPHLCWHPPLGPSGACRLCTVRVDGRLVSACTTPAAAGQVVESETGDLRERRSLLVQLLFAEGNHFCPGCEKSGNCRLQDAGYALGVTGPGFEEFFPRHAVDASHPDVWLDFNRCILCKLCVRASWEVDGKGVFQIGGHGTGTRVIVNSPRGRLVDSALAADDLAARICPVGAIGPKRLGYAVPIGQRPADRREPAEHGGPGAAP